MIITKLIGGLGNQLFQFAFGKCLAEKNNAELKIDISAFETYALHEYSLSFFCDDSMVASHDEIEMLKARNGAHIKERSFAFDSEMLSLGDNVYIEGYWQSERYFQNVRSLVCSDICVPLPFSPLVEKRKDQICSTQSVALHVRRGDYVSNETTLKYHGLCSLEYYFHAIEVLCGKLYSPVFYVFSDDIEWAKKNFSSCNCDIRFIDDSNANYIDLMLMSYCKHTIIANSSFSWWGAWLNTNPDKIVIAPKPWFSAEVDDKDLIPSEWVLLNRFHERVESV